MIMASFVRASGTTPKAQRDLLRVAQSTLDPYQLITHCLTRQDPKVRSRVQRPAATRSPGGLGSCAFEVRLQWRGQLRHLRDGTSFKRLIG